ncbi:MAG: magnesium/cobalt transporter CorA [Opitutales bacterium]
MPGSSPGIESIPEIHTPPSPGAVRVRCTDYAQETVEVHEIDDLIAFLEAPRPAGAKVRWLNFDGLHPWVVDQVRRHFGFHTLAAEDVLRVPQRPKVESYEDHLFIVVRMLLLKDEQAASEQVGIFLYGDTLITFQERAGDVWDPVRQRLQSSDSRLRQQDVSYLLYALLDAVVDHCFPILESYGDHLEKLEDEIMFNATTRVQRRIHAVKRELSLLRRVLWPTREVVSHLLREEGTELTDYAKTYMRDVYDHTIQVMDVVETYREMAASLSDLYMSVVSNRMNEVMKVLTIMASFFIPITFVAGVYGMNFEHMPELGWKYSYAVFWLVCLGMSAGLGVYFYRKRWIGRH